MNPLTYDNRLHELRDTLQNQLEGTHCTASMGTLAQLRTQALRTYALLSDTSDATANICDFIRQYILSSVEYIESFYALGEKSGTKIYVQPFLTEAEQFFVITHPVIDPLPEIEALLCRAYLAHRMLEELNDHIAVARGLPLAPIDTTQTNLVVHVLIGDEPANQLDQTVLIQMELLITQLADKAQAIFNSKAVQQLTLEQQQQGWQDVLARWPFLSDQLGHDLAGH